MPKNIVICCDGTGNEFGDRNSNVVKLYATLAVGPEQVAYYHPGVGTMGAPAVRTRLGKLWTIFTGLAFGAGIKDNIADAYRYLMNTYEENDRIYIFGFSRGAYTVRALAGMLHMFGLLHRGNEGQIPYILRMFSRRSRQAAGMQEIFDTASEFKQTFSYDCQLHFVGVWDTVSSVGWIYDPVKLPYTARNPIMKTGRHAVSIDERRCFFRNNLWGKPLASTDSQYIAPQDIKQVWFAGVHSDVGGSYHEAQSGLSKLALEWMLTEAARHELRIDKQKAITVLGENPDVPKYVKPDVAAELHNSLKWWWPLELLPHRSYDWEKKKQRWSIPLGRRRYIPEGSIIHQTVEERHRKALYRPPNLPENYTIEPRVAFSDAESAVRHKSATTSK